MLQAFDAAIDDQDTARQRLHHGALTGQSHRSSSRTHRYRRARRRRGHGHAEVLRADLLQGQCRELRQHWPRL
jgi:hypothetical protein